MPPNVPRSVMPRAGKPRTAARANNSSTWEAPRRKEKFVVVWSSVYKVVKGLFIWWGILWGFVRGMGFMNHEGSEAPGAHEEDWGSVDVEMVTNRVIGLAIKVHRTIGPALLESVHGDCLGFEIARSGLRVDRQMELSLVYEGVRFSRVYRADLVVEKSVILEIKSVETILPVHISQI